MAVRPDFLWLGNHPAIDLVNTELVVDGRPVDLLDGTDALRSWATRAGVMGRDDSSPTSERGWARALRFVHRLRAALRAALEPSDVDAAAVDELNEVLRDAPGVLHVDASSDLADVSLRADGGPAAQVCLDIAALAVGIFGHDRGRVRRCDNPNCSLMFLDTSKSGRRRWCEMSTCGNRAKAAAHYARSRTPR